MDSFQGKGIKLRLGDADILKDLDLSVPRGKVCTIIGPNGSGKSTLLRVLSRLLSPDQGRILLDGKDIHSYPSKEVAKKLSLLPQLILPPEGILVEDLVWFGRHPYQSLWKKKSTEDHDAVEKALEMMKITSLRNRQVDQLSGGQKQRAYLAMTLAQDTDLLLLDEPTTYLDLHYQFEILGLLLQLNRELSTTILMVLHDLNMASLYSDYIFLMDQGKIVGQGHPREVFRGELLEKVFMIKTVEVKTSHPTDKPQFIFSHPT